MTRMVSHHVMYLWVQVTDPRAVLTKVFVYCGIGMLASGVMPVMFEVVGWGL